jgi:Arc/MetJ-type ribon-helix-helix transcriptional regulator
MQITLNNPELEKFIEEQVRSGSYASPEAMVQAALLDMRGCSETELDDETIDAINEAEAQADRGEGMDLDEFRAHMKRYMSSTE